MAFVKTGILPALLGLVVAACTGCAPNAAAATEPPVAAATRVGLLDRANEVALLIPSPSFEKDRAKMQLAVVECCLACGMLDEAARFAAPMEVTWRRGEAHALVAQAFARAGDSRRAREFAERAAGGASDYPDWAAARVRAGAAKAFVVLGELDRADQLVGPGDPAMMGEVQAVSVERAPLAELDAKADMFDKAIATRNFDLAKGGIDGYLALLGRFAKDPGRMDRATKALDEAIPGLPFDLQVAYRARMAERLQASGASGRAAQEIATAVRLFDTTAFLAEDVAPVGAALARSRARLGDAEGARRQLDGLESAYRSRIAEITDLRRATSLRALAEARFAIGDRDRAMRLWAEALDAGALNPNARPRAEDLCATLVSMAGAGAGPTRAMEARVAEIRAGLVAPW